LDIQNALEKEADYQWEFLNKEISERLDWYNRIADEAFNHQALILSTDRDAVDVILRRCKALIADLKENNANGLSEMENEFRALSNRAEDVEIANTEKRHQLFREIFFLRRQISFLNPLLDFDEIIFTASNPGGDFHMVDQYFGVFARPGGSILKLKNPFSDHPYPEDLLNNKRVKSGRLKGRDLKGGMFLFPELSWDAKKILFAYSECGRDLEKPTPYELITFNWSKETSFHIFKMNADGTDLVQLTDGAWNDVHPCWMPDGRIAFISERRGGFLRCSGDRPCPNYTLHAMDADGSNMNRLSHHETNEWHPSIDNNGMLVYTRWDYVDRGDEQGHHPWITTPDGRNPRSIHGNFKYKHQDNPDMEVYVRPIPNSQKYVSLAAPHHSGSYGTLIVIDPAVEDDDAMAPVKRLTPEDGFPESVITNPDEYEKNELDKTFRPAYWEGGYHEPHRKMYSAAWALSENYYLTTKNKKLYLIDAFGNWELLYEIPGMYCFGPVPLKQREKPPVIAPMSKPLQLVSNPQYTKVGDEHPIDTDCEGFNQDGEMLLLDVYNSLYPFPENAKVKELRIIQVLVKNTPAHQDPAIGYGAETPARAVLGTVPVEEDGSAYFNLPPGKLVYFQALDENGEAIQSMKSGTYVQGGERISCIGCHEKKKQTPNPVRGRVMALNRKPSDIKPEAAGSNPFSFPRLVQPILDKHCIQCHNGSDEPDHAFDLRSGNWKEDEYKWYTSYRNLHKYAWHAGSFQPGYDMWLSPRSIPGKVGAKASKLLPLLKNGHGKTDLTKDELRRIVLWLDANSDFFGSYENLEEQAMGEVVYPVIE